MMPSAALQHLQFSDCPVQGALDRFFHHHALADVFKHPLLVGFSGGLDSTVMLHALVARGLKVHALHVQHNLQAAAAQWPEHCRAVCATLGVPFDCMSVQVEEGTLGLEAQARIARYQAIFAWMQRHHAKALFCAHHKDDQLETVVLQMLRGSGLRGLAGMRDFGPVGVDRDRHPDFRICRPLLVCDKSELQAYAKRHALSVVEDPSNADLNLRRNWVRLKLLPELREHFPQADFGLLRLADHFKVFFDDEDRAYQALRPLICDSSNRLKLPVWHTLDESTRVHALKAWLLQHGIRCGHDKLLEMHRQLFETQRGGIRQVARDWQIKVSRGKAWPCTAPL